MGDLLNENYGKNKLVRLEERDLIGRIGDMVVEEDVCTGDVRMWFDLHGLALRVLPLRVLGLARMQRNCTRFG